MSNGKLIGKMILLGFIALFCGGQAVVKPPAPQNPPNAAISNDPKQFFIELLLGQLEEKPAKLDAERASRVISQLDVTYVEALLSVFHSKQAGDLRDMALIQVSRLMQLGVYPEDELSLALRTDRPELLANLRRVVLDGTEDLLIRMQAANILQQIDPLWVDEEFEACLELTKRLRIIDPKVDQDARGKQEALLHALLQTLAATSANKARALDLFLDIVETESKRAGQAIRLGIKLKTHSERLNRRILDVIINDPRAAGYFLGGIDQLPVEMRSRIMPLLVTRLQNSLPNRGDYLAAIGLCGQWDMPAFRLLTSLVEGENTEDAERSTAAEAARMMVRTVQKFTAEQEAQVAKLCHAFAKNLNHETPLFQPSMAQSLINILVKHSGAFKPEERAAWISQLTAHFDKDFEIDMSKLGALGRLDAKVQAKIIASMNHKDRNISISAWIAFADCMDSDNPNHRSLVTAGARSPDFAMRKQAAWVMTRFKDYKQEDFDLLTNLLGDDTIAVRSSAASLLNKVAKDPRYRDRAEPLRRIMSHDREWSVRLAIQNNWTYSEND